MSPTPEAAAVQPVITTSENETVALVVKPAASTPQETAPAPASASRKAGHLREYLESLLVTIILALFGTTFVVQAFKIPSPSMEGTLLVGDHLLVNKFIYGGRDGWLDRVLPYRDVQRGDIIVFKFPFDDHAHYVKRVIAVPGDRLKIVDNQVFLNGRALTEPYKVHDPDAYVPFGDNFPPANRYFPQGNVRREWSERMFNFVEQGELVVPAGKYFVMGDNRDHSWDSRYWGFVDRENIMGRPLLIYWSVEATSDDYNDRTLSGRLTGLTHTLVNLPKKTRWSRMLRAVR
ncbi:MAG TPA: signal peptidase I [Candidatus Nitrosotenuis sp.]|nr:signal peptidase I [Candidatus Nitrosotenuis sp.]